MKLLFTTSTAFSFVNRRMSICVAAIAVLIGPLSPVTARTAASGQDMPAQQAGEAFTLKTAGGAQPATLYRIAVPEIYGSASTARVTLSAVKWAAQSTPTRPPVLFLAGGPGQSAIGSAQVQDVYDILQRARSASDVWLVDQRGTGASVPRLVCPASAPLSGDVFLSSGAMQRALEPALIACRDTWKSRGVQLEAYTTEASADDVAEFARAAGIQRLSLFAFSYGTHLAAAIVRRHPALVERVVFAGFEGPDDTEKLPWVYDAQVARIAALVDRQSDIHRAMTDFKAALADVLDRAARQPFEVTAGSVTLHIGREGLLYLLRLDIGDTNDLPQLPRLVAQLQAGDTTMLAALAGRRYRQLGSGVSLMGLAMDCASGVSAARQALIAEQTDRSTFGTMTNPMSQACTVLGIHPLPDAYRQPIVSGVAALFVSGTLDSNTPPYQAEMARWGFYNSAHLIVEQAGHESTLVAEVRDAIAAFLRGETVPSRTIAGPPVVFAPVG